MTKQKRKSTGKIRQGKRKRKGKWKWKEWKKEEEESNRPENNFPGKLVCLLVLVFSSEPQRFRLSPRAQDRPTGTQRLSREHTKISTITNHQNRRTLDCLFTSLKRGGFIFTSVRSGFVYHVVWDAQVSLSCLHKQPTSKLGLKSNVALSRGPAWEPVSTPPFWFYYEWHAQTQHFWGPNSCPPNADVQIVSLN